MTFLRFTNFVHAYFCYVVKINGFTTAIVPQNFLNKNMINYVEKKNKITCLLKKNLSA